MEEEYTKIDEGLYDKPASAGILTAVTKKMK